MYTVNTPQSCSPSALQALITVCSPRNLHGVAGHNYRYYNILSVWSNYLQSQTLLAARLIVDNIQPVMNLPFNLILLNFYSRFHSNYKLCCFRRVFLKYTTSVSLSTY